MGAIVTILKGAVVTAFVRVLQLGSIVTALQCATIGVMVQCCNMASTDAVFALER